MTNIVVARQRNIQVSTNATGGIIQTTVPVTLQSVPTLSSANTRLKLEDLIDVDVGSEVEGATLVYHANTDSFVIEPATIDKIDGGTF
jgi:hypothetical protein